MIRDTNCRIAVAQTDDRDEFGYAVCTLDEDGTIKGVLLDMMQRDSALAILDIWREYDPEGKVVAAIAHEKLQELVAVRLHSVRPFNRTLGLVRMEKIIGLVVESILTGIEA